MLRRSIVFDLDAPISIKHLSGRLNAEVHPPEVLLRCERLADHKWTMSELARLRKAGSVRMHQTVVQTDDLSGDRELRQALIRLGASVYLEGVSWPAPDLPIAGLDEMTRDCVPVHAVMAPDLSILDEAQRRPDLYLSPVFVYGSTRRRCGRQGTPERMILSGSSTRCTRSRTNSAMS
jgi:hypothetical protein